MIRIMKLEDNMTASGIAGASQSIHAWMLILFLAVCVSVKLC